MVQDDALARVVDTGSPERCRIVGKDAKLHQQMPAVSRMALAISQIAY